MGFYERIDARGVRETGRPVSFVPKGALTHHLLKQAVVALPLVGHVRSPRGLRLLREPYVQCHISADLLSLATQLVAGVAIYAKYRRFNRRHPTNCPHKPATGSFVCGYDPLFNIGSFSFCEKETKTRSERTVRTNGDLPLGSKGGQPRCRAICGGSFRLSELHQYSKRLRWRKTRFYTQERSCMAGGISARVRPD